MCEQRGHRPRHFRLMVCTVRTSSIFLRAEISFTLSSMNLFTTRRDESAPSCRNTVMNGISSDFSLRMAAQECVRLETMRIGWVSRAPRAFQQANDARIRHSHRCEGLFRRRRGWLRVWRAHTSKNVSTRQRRYGYVLTPFHLA
jgi:hypothetical protein